MPGASASFGYFAVTTRGAARRLPLRASYKHEDVRAYAFSSIDDPGLQYRGGY